MKKIRFFHVLGLVLLLVIGLVGCGGGPDDHLKSGAIQFTLPNIYYTSKDYRFGADIPSGKTVKFYTTLTKIPDTTDTTTTINADYTFTGTTGNTNLQFDLPDSLNNQERYIYAMIILNGSFDLQGKTQTDIQNAISRKEILFSAPPDKTQPVLLTKDGTVNTFTFVGAADKPLSIIHFNMPSTYYTSSDYSTNATIPSEKTVKFYTLSDISNNTINADYIFSGTTGSSNLSFTLPDNLQNPNPYIYAVIILNGSFDLQGKTQAELIEAIKNKEVIFGKTVSSGSFDDSTRVTLKSGSTINNFVFTGISHNSTSMITFAIPNIYYDYPPATNYSSYAKIPSGKPIKFYTVSESDISNPTINADDYSFSGFTTTDSNVFTFSLPDNLKNQTLCIYAVVTIRDSFDIKGKTRYELDRAISDGKILFGKTTTLPVPSGDSKAVPLTGNSTINNFTFVGKIN